MTAIPTIERVKDDPFPALVSDLEIEFGTAGIEALATYFLEAEAADFHWDARMNEQHLGAYESVDGDDFELDRVAIIGWIAGRWYVAACIVDGDGAVHDMIDLQHFESAGQAEGAFDDMH
ncbi:hypothetical protein [Sphingomonas cavernae]|uniref:Uncharacterized protein n=1 Tax=Sphingomonas cavernae TaxID=2320861 RepID=A0A418WJU9_9SPHN|nr:hypothetical protein [Sphingomonas cavernae]RJF90307.1 hypothetical protein D3876_08560 [Sphingomonas cavernae]